MSLKCFFKILCWGLGRLRKNNKGISVCKHLQFSFQNQSCFHSSVPQLFRGCHKPGRIKSAHIFVSLHSSSADFNAGTPNVHKIRNCYTQLWWCKQIFVPTQPLLTSIYWFAWVGSKQCDLELMESMKSQKCWNPCCAWEQWKIPLLKLPYSWECHVSFLAEKCNHHFCNTGPLFSVKWHQNQAEQFSRQTHKSPA